MFARKLTVHIVAPGTPSRPAPLKALDSFSMRNFTNDAIFDDTLPVADGQLEAGHRVPLDLLRDRMTDWFRRKNYLAKDEELRIAEPFSQPAVDIEEAASRNPAP